MPLDSMFFAIYIRCATNNNNNQKTHKMKKTIPRMLACLAIASLITLYSCNKEKMNPGVPNPQVVSVTSEISVKNGRLVFKDEATFQKHTQWVFENQSKSQVIIGKYKQLGLTKSMMEVSLESDKLSDDTESKEYSNFCKKYPNVFLPVEFENSILYSLQGPPSTAYLANTDGLFQIGNDVHRVSYSYYYILKGEDESKIASLILAKGSISDPSITVTSTHSQTTRTIGYYVTAYWNSNYRIVGESTYYYGSGVSEMYVKTTAQRKSFGIWSQTNNIKYVYVTWPQSVGYWVDGGAFTIPAGNSYVVYTQATTGWVQVYRALGQVDFSPSSCVASHKGYGNNKNNQTSGNVQVDKDIFH